MPSTSLTSMNERSRGKLGLVQGILAVFDEERYAPHLRLELLFCMAWEAARKGDDLDGTLARAAAAGLGIVHPSNYGTSERDAAYRLETAGYGLLITTAFQHTARALPSEQHEARTAEEAAACQAGNGASAGCFRCRWYDLSSRYLRARADACTGNCDHQRCALPGHRHVPLPRALRPPAPLSPRRHHRLAPAPGQ